MQAGDVPQTRVDVSELENMGYQSSTRMDEGVEQFVDWYKNYIIENAKSDKDED